MRLGNTVLVEHGIQTEESDFRLHVGFASGRAYLFPTESGQKVIKRPGHGYSTFRAKQPGVDIVTGIGYKVPHKDVDGCEEIVIPQEVLSLAPVAKTDGPGEKGRAAMMVARTLLKRGLVPLPLLPREVTDADMQIRGADIIVTCRLRIQVKCDWWATQYGLSLQTAECNPLGIH